MKDQEKTRCFGGPEDPLMTRYHDEEWGVPVHDDRLLFEFLALEGAQAGLSWQTILRKRENYREAFEMALTQQRSRPTGRLTDGGSWPTPVLCATG